MKNDTYSNADIERLLFTNWKQQMLNLVNAARSREGSGELCLNTKLSVAAKSHAQDMVDNNFFSHTGSDGSSFEDRVKRVNYSYSNLAENLAGNFFSVQVAHDALMGSSGHRINIMNPVYEQIGLGRVIKPNGAQYYAQLFGRSDTETCDIKENNCVDSTFRLKTKKEEWK